MILCCFLGSFGLILMHPIYIENSYLLHSYSDVLNMILHSTIKIPTMHRASDFWTAMHSERSTTNNHGIFLPFDLVPEIILSICPYTPWNYLPEEIVQCKSLSSFKTAVHSHLVYSHCLSHLVLFGPVKFAIFLVAF